MKNNLADLYREYARCADMCSEYNEGHKTDIQPRKCVQLKSATGEWVGYFSTNEPNFAELLQHKVRFAVAILTGKPIFIGETVYSPEGERYRVNGSQLTCMTGKYKNWCLGFIGADELGFLTEPPKKPRTFMLNGVELPCPVKNGTPYILNLAHDGTGISLHFESYEDSHQWKVALHKIFDEALNKE